MEINAWMYAFEPPGPAFSDSTDTKYNWNEMSMIPDLANYPLNHEVLGTIVYFTGPFINTSEIDVYLKFYNNNTSTLLWEGHQYIPPPETGYQWDWYKTKFWVGHAPWEISGPMTIRAEINLSGWVSGSATIYLDVIDTTVIQGVRASVGATYNVPSGSPQFDIWILYGIDVDGTIERFAESGPYEWAFKQFTVNAPGQSRIVDVDLSGEAVANFPSGTYDALVRILKPANGDRLCDWEIYNNVFTR